VRIVICDQPVKTSEVSETSEVLTWASALRVLIAYSLSASTRAALYNGISRGVSWQPAQAWYTLLFQDIFHALKEGLRRERLLEEWNVSLANEIPAGHIVQVAADQQDFHVRRERLKVVH